MSHKIIGKRLSVFFLHRFGENGNILCKIVPAVLMSNKAQFVCIFCCFSMTEMVVSEADIAVLCELAHKEIIPFDMLCHPVNNVKKSYRIAFGNICFSGKRVYSVRRRNKFFVYCNAHFFLLKIPCRN